MAERLVLALDGSTRVCSAALLRPAGAGVGAPVRWEVAARRAEVDGRGQARVLLRLVDEMLEELGAGPKDLGAIVAGVGPGTFTGVRIAVATARGLALSLAVPVLGVSTLAALAAGAAGAAAGAAVGGAAPWTRVVPVVDARRQQVFFGLYEAAGRGGRVAGAQWVRGEDFGVCDTGALGTLLAARDASSAAHGGSAAPGGGRSLVVGEARALVGDLPEGAEFLEAAVEAERLVTGQELLEEPAGLGGGTGTAAWLLDLFTRGGFGLAGTGETRPVAGSGQRAAETGTPETVRPIYVRSPDADVHITKMKDPWGDESERR